jgi:hypothetical protein
MLSRSRAHAICGTADAGPSFNSLPQHLKATDLRRPGSKGGDPGRVTIGQIEEQIYEQIVVRTAILRVDFV